jgi:hypothetical protein
MTSAVPDARNRLRAGNQRFATQGFGSRLVGAEYSLESGVVDFFDGGDETPGR